MLKWFDSRSRQTLHRGTHSTRSCATLRHRDGKFYSMNATVVCMSCTGTRCASALPPSLSSKLPMQITIIRCQLTLFYELKFNRYISDLITMWQIFAWAHPKLPKFNWKTFVRMENDIFDANAAAAAAAVDLWRLRSELRWFVAHV